MSEKSVEKLSVKPVDKGTVFPFLRIYEEEGPFLKSFKISTKEVVVGRDKSATLRVQDKYISRKHFQIEFLGPGKLFLQDLGSANGTYLNGKKVERAKLKDGDEIVVGEKRVVVSYKLPKPRVEVPKVFPGAESKTMPDYRDSEQTYEKTEVTAEEESRARGVVEHTVPEEQTSETEEVPAKRFDVAREIERRLEPTREDIFEQPTGEAKMPAQVFEIPEKERRVVARERAYPVGERRIKLSRVVLFFIVCIGIFFVFLFVVKFAGNYFAGKKEKTPDEIAMAGREEKPDYLREKPRPPQPSRKTFRPRSSVPSPEKGPEPRGEKIEEKTEEEIEPGKTKSEGNVEERIAESRPRRMKSPEKSRRTAASKQKASEQKIITLGKRRSKSRPKRETVKRLPPPKIKQTPTAATEAVRTLRKKEVLGVKLDSASKTLVASREIRNGKETRKSRDIDLAEVRKLIDIDVNLSIMSEEVMLSEQRDVNKFRNNLKDKVSAVSYCYMDALKRNPSVHGTTKVSFTVGRRGRVSHASISSSSIRDRVLNACIINRVKGTVFDEPPHDNFTISYTFNFKRSTMDFTR